MVASATIAPTAMEDAAVKIQRWWWQSPGCRITGPTGKDARKIDEAVRKIQRAWMSIPRYYNFNFDGHVCHYGRYTCYELRNLFQDNTEEGFWKRLREYNEQLRQQDIERRKRAWKRRAEYEGQQYELAANKIRFWWRCFPECGDCGVRNEILGGWRQLCWSCYDSRYGR